MSEKRWYEKPMRIATFQLNQGVDMHDMPDIVHQAGFNVEQLLHVVGEGVMGLYDNERDYDNLSRYVQRSHELGTKIILYFNTHMMTRKAFGEKPDWGQRNREGSHIDSYGSYILTCVNTHWREDMERRLREALEIPIDGIFLDGPFFDMDICFCEACSRLFKMYRVIGFIIARMEMTQAIYIK